VISAVEYIVIPGTNEKISRIGLGTWQFSEAWGVLDYEFAKQIVVKALESGINFFDTALVYGNGKSEEFLGKALKELGIRREEVFIATKIPGQFLDPHDVFKSVDRSLKRLGVEYVDLMQLHWPPCWHNHPTCPYMRALERLVELGKIRYLGVSNYPVALIEEVRSCLSRTDIKFMQYRYNLIERQAEIELIPYAEKNNMIFLPWSPLAKGALTGKYTLENLPKFTDVRESEPVFHPGNFKQIQPLVDELLRLSKEYGKTPAQISLNWIISYSKNILPIPGAKKPEQVVDNAGSVGWRLEYEDWRTLDEISKKIRISYAVGYLY